MAVIGCKMCGGSMVLSEDKTFGICEYCGSIDTLPKIKINDEQRAAVFNRGNNFRRRGEFDKALAVYEEIIQEDDTDAEAHWCCALCRFGIEYVEDPATCEWLPTCHRASFDSFLMDVDYLAAVEHSDGITRRQYQKNAIKIAEVQKGILAVSQNEEPFDVFICYKESEEDGSRTRDSLLAQDIYYQLTEQGRKVFFARITLEDKGGIQYEPYIFAALNSARVMVVVGTSAEHLNAVWVKNEWSRYLALMRKDRTRLILPCYRDMDPYDLPEQLSVLQSYDMGKIGFIQDLIRGINKVLGSTRSELQEEKVIVPNRPDFRPETLLKRGNMALEDGDWNKADDFFEDVLNQNAECAEAYWGKFLAANHCTNLDEFVSKRLMQTEKANRKVQLLEMGMDDFRKKAMEKYAVGYYLSEKEIYNLFTYEGKLEYSACTAFREKQYKEEQAFFETDKYLLRTLNFADEDMKKKIDAAQNTIYIEMEQRISAAKREEDNNIEKMKCNYAAFLKSAEEKAAVLYQEACEKREKDYVTACENMEKEQYEGAVILFQKLGDYRDSREKAETCEKNIDRLLELELQHAKTNISAERTIIVTVTIIIISIVIFIFYS